MIMTFFHWVGRLFKRREPSPMIAMANKWAEESNQKFLAQYLERRHRARMALLEPQPFSPNAGETQRSVVAVHGNNR